MSGANDPAFASPAAWHPLHEMQIGGSMGMTKRELFAAMAMQGLVGNTTISGSAKAYARDAIAIADALLAALEDGRP